MKTLLMSHLYPTPDDPYIGAFVHEQAKELVSLGCDITVVAPVKYSPFPVNRLSRKWRAYSEIPVHTKIDGIPVFYPRYWSLPKNILFHRTGEWLFRASFQMIRELHEWNDFDLIHAHVALPDGYAAMRIAAKLNLPFELTIHGRDFYDTIHQNNMARENVKRAIENANKVILVSNRLNEIRLAHFNDLDDSKFCVIHNGIDSLFLTGADESRKASSFPVLLSVSNLIQRKGIKFNILAVAELVKKYRNLQYWIVGKGEEEKSLKRLVNQLNLSEHVKFLGAKNRHEVKQLMDQCDIFSMPSWNEAFGLVYIEAMACGKPVIGCYGEGVQEIVTDNVDGCLVPPRDAQSIIKVLDCLLADPIQRNQIGKSAETTVRNNFTWERNAERIFRLYKNTLKDR